MSLTGLMLGFAVAQGKHLAPSDTTRIALVSALPKSPVLGLVLASALASRDVPPPAPAASGSSGGTTAGSGGTGTGGTGGTGATGAGTAGTSGSGGPGAAPPPPAPSLLKVGARARVHEIELSWKAPAQAANVNYTIYRLNYERDAQDPEKIIGPVQTTKYEDEKLPADTGYVYIVQAADAGTNAALGTGWVAARTKVEKTGQAA